MSALLACILACNPNCPVPEQMAGHLLVIEKQHKVPAPVMASLIFEESRWRPRCRGAAGEVGLCQIHPCHSPPKGWTAQMDWAAAHLRELWCRYGSLEVALAAYNGGPKGRKKAVCKRYARRILRRAEDGNH